MSEFSKRLFATFKERNCGSFETYYHYIPLEGNLSEFMALEFSLKNTYERHVQAPDFLSDPEFTIDYENPKYEYEVDVLVKYGSVDTCDQPLHNKLEGIFRWSNAMDSLAHLTISGEVCCFAGYCSETVWENTLLPKTDNLRKLYVAPEAESAEFKSQLYELKSGEEYTRDFFIETLSQNSGLNGIRKFMFLE